MGHIVAAGADNRTMTVVHPYDPRWPDVFAAEAAVLMSALGEALVDGIHHIGSTSIPGMPAKPVIDMMAGVATLAHADRAEPTLARAGYVRRPHRIDAVLYVKGDGERDAFSLQLTVPGSELWRERLTFRDAVRADPELVAQYTDLKMRLLEESGGAPYDAADKRAFVSRVLADAGHTLRENMHS
jgi:GrpB-like predicted nucleotidyltransferase (UPF0157 family)